MGSSLYEGITHKQIDAMKHALGFDTGRVTGSKHRRFTAYRNAFYAGGKSARDWETLVVLGLASELNGGGFTVTSGGRAFLEAVTGVKFEVESSL